MPITTPTDMREVQVVEIREQKQPWGVTWTMILEKWFSRTGKSFHYTIYHNGGQSYPVGTYRTKKAAYKDLDSFTNYKKVG